MPDISTVSNGPNIVSNPADGAQANIPNTSNVASTNGAATGSSAAAVEQQMLNLILTGNISGGNAGGTNGSSTGRSYANSLYPDEIEL